MTKDDCIFCKIIAGQLGTKRVWENDSYLVIEDLHPKAPVHVLLIPKNHVENLNMMEATSKESGKLVSTIQEVVRKLQINDAYQVHVNTGKKAGQQVFHFHVHLMGGWSKPVEY